MHTIIISSGVNKRFRKDATGAFLPEAVKLNKMIPESLLLAVDMVRQKPMEKMNRLAHVCQGLISHDTQAMYFFGHGWQTGFQGGFQGKSAASLLALYIKETAPNLKLLVFYACSMGRGSDNFLKWLSDDLPHLKIVGHTTTGHTTHNPNACIYRGGEKTLICPRGDKQRKQWIRALKTDFSLMYSDMSIKAIKEHLG